MRNGDWMQTYTGKKFWPLDPRVEEVDIYDIAHALSNLCRFGGHSKKFYSVAEHCFHISHSLPSEYALWGLLHDGSEAYAQDIIRAIKYVLLNYKEIESNLMEVIVKKFNLTPRTMPVVVKAADSRILNDEHKQVMGRDLNWWHDSEVPLGVNIKCWNPGEAEHWFLTRFKEINKEK